MSSKVFDRYSAGQALLDSLHSENQILNNQVDSLRSYVKTNLEPSADELALMKRLHKEYQSLADRYTDSLRTIPQEHDNFDFEKLQYIVRWGDEMLKIKENAKKQNPSFAKTIEEDYIHNSFNKYFKNNL